ncbi:MAG: hypothetical protein ACPG5T_02530 [Endozoicomonas sp.]
MSSTTPLKTMADSIDTHFMYEQALRLAKKCHYNEAFLQLEKLELSQSLKHLQSQIPHTASPENRDSIEMIKIKMTICDQASTLSDAYQLTGKLPPNYDTI